MKYMISPSHAGTISYLAQNLQNENNNSKKFYQTGQDIDENIVKIATLHSEPVLKRLEKCYEEMNKIETNLKKLNQSKQKIES
mmetsp:Transcript_37308/g.33466  ORF Transcript_37308/g.33466 Transcript_37308/m.33466 type:complete len:83 (-) Transcript_37308:347-595(-)